MHFQVFEKFQALNTKPTRVKKIWCNTGFYSLEFPKNPDASAFVIIPLVPKAKVCDVYDKLKIKLIQFYLF